MTGTLKAQYWTRLFGVLLFVVMLAAACNGGEWYDPYNY